MQVMLFYPHRHQSPQCHIDNDYSCTHILCILIQRQTMYRKNTLCSFLHYSIYLYGIVEYTYIYVYIKYNTMHRAATSTEMYTNIDMTGELRFVSFIFNIKIPNEIQQML